MDRITALLDGPAPRRVPAAQSVGATVVDAHLRRGAADDRGRHPRRGVDHRRRLNHSPRTGQRGNRSRARALHGRRLPSDAPRHHHPPRPTVRERRRCIVGDVDAPRRAYVGARARRTDGDAHWNIREPHNTGQRSARDASEGGGRASAIRQYDRHDPRRRDRSRLTWPTDGARSLARRPRRRHTADVVRAAR